MSAPIGIVANPISGKDIRRLIANAATSTLQEKYTIVRRAVIGAAEVGIDEFWFLPEPHRISERAVETLDLDATYHHPDLELRFTETDTIGTVAAMREAGCGAIVTLGGDGTNRAATVGWRDVPLVPISTGTNNVFPRFLEATIAGAAAGLVAGGHVPLEDVATAAKIIDISVEDEPDDIALVDAVLVAERFVGSRALFEPTALRTAVLSRAEPGAIGISAIGGLLCPCPADDDAAVTVAFARDGADGRRLRAPMAPGLYTDVRIEACRSLQLGEEVEVRGPGILAFDGERHRALRPGQKATMRVTRTGPLVIDVDAALLRAAAASLYTDREPTRATR